MGVDDQAHSYRKDTNGMYLYIKVVKMYESVFSSTTVCTR